MGCNPPPVAHSAHYAALMAPYGLGAQKRQLPDLIWASVHYFDDEREVGVFIGKIRGILGG